MINCDFDIDLGIFIKGLSRIRNGVVSVWNTAGKYWLNFSAIGVGLRSHDSLLMTGAVGH